MPAFQRSLFGTHLKKRTTGRRRVAAGYRRGIDKGLKMQVISIPADKTDEHFGPFLRRAAMMDMPGSSEWTRKMLGCEPTDQG